VISEPGAVAAVRRILRRLAAQRVVEVQKASLEESARLRQDLLRRIRADVPGRIQSVEVESELDLSTCPRVVIFLPADATNRVKAWANYMVALFGTRRITWEYLKVIDFKSADE
jgi:uncharacterized protein YnzC (UPF0291/DUF896 family)